MPALFGNWKKKRGGGGIPATASRHLQPRGEEKGGKEGKRKVSLCFQPSIHRGERGSPSSHIGEGKNSSLIFPLRDGEENAEEQALLNKMPIYSAEAGREKRSANCNSVLGWTN